MLTSVLNLSSARRRQASFGLAISLSLSATAMGCGGDDGSTPMAVGGAGTGGVAGMGAAAGMGGSSNFTGTVVESVNEKPIPSSQLMLTVRALDNATGAPLPGKEAATNESAMVTFPDLPQPVGFMIQGVPAQAIDTYTFNVDPFEQGKLLRVVAKSSVLTVKTVANVTLDPQKADLAGAIYWINAQGQQEPVGCATVTIDDGQGEIRYFASNNLPTTNVALEMFPDLEVRMATNPLNGRFFITGTNPGMHTITAYLNGQVVGTATLPGFQGAMSTDGENAISLTDITIPGAANPTPADCI